MSNAVSFKEGDRVEVGGFVVFVSRFWRNWALMACDVSQWCVRVRAQVLCEAVSQNCHEESVRAEVRKVLARTCAVSHLIGVLLAPGPQRQQPRQEEAMDL